MTVLDTSAVIDYLLANGVADDVRDLLAAQGSAAAPDLLVFECRRSCAARSCTTR